MTLLNQWLKPVTGSISANDYAVEALDLLQKKKQDWAFVLDRNEVIGMVSRRALEKETQDTLHHEDVRNFVDTNVMLVDAATPPQELKRLSHKHPGMQLGMIEKSRPVGLVRAELL